MTVNDVLSLVDTYRPCLIGTSDKTNWLYTIEKEVCEHMSRYGEPRSPAEDFNLETELSLGKEYLDMYVYYVISMIDLANQDVAMYNNSCSFFNEMLSSWKKKWRREHLPQTTSV